MQFAIIGLYNSGSSLLAEALHHLGCNMGPPFWYDYFESASLRNALVEWWKEPQLESSVQPHDRIDFLRRWLRDREPEGTPVGAKHPLLCMSADDVAEAWGSETRYIWSYRELEASIAGLARREWFDDPKRVQETLWKAASDFFVNHQHLRVDFPRVLKQPQREFGRMIDYLDLNPSSEQQLRALHCIRV